MQAQQELYLEVPEHQAAAADKALLKAAPEPVRGIADLAEESKHRD